MNKQWHVVFLPIVLAILFVIISVNTLSANPFSDTGKKLLIAGLDKKEAPATIIIAPNVVFPAILTGHEEQSVDYIEKFAGDRKDYIIRTFNKGKKYFPKVTAILNKYGLPTELKVLLALESAFKANAVSKAGAVGYWQFMDEVAKEYGLKISAQLSANEKKKLLKKDKKKAEAQFKEMAKKKDDRKNFNKSTYAAARYLKDRAKNLNNDILLMVASYTCGIGNVWGAMASCGKNDPTFWDIKDRLPAETRAYVMNFITLNVIFENYENFCNNNLNFKPIKVNLGTSGLQSTEQSLD